MSQLPLVPSPAEARIWNFLVPTASHMVHTRESNGITRCTRVNGLFLVLPGTGHMAGISHPKADSD